MNLEKLGINANIFFFNNVRFQIVASIFLLVIEFSYFRRRKLPTEQVRVFSCMMIFAIIYMISDYLTVYGIVYYEKVNPLFVRIAHQVFIASINTILLSVYLYVVFVSGNFNKFEKIKTYIVLGIYVISLFHIIFGGIGYYRTDKGIYSFGIMPDSIFYFGTFYLILTVIKTIRISIKEPNSYIDSKQYYIFAAIFVWFATLVIQYFNKTLLISSVGITLMIFILYLGLENPGEYIDRESDSFNSLAFKLVMQQKLKNKKSFYVVNLDIENLMQIEKQYGETVLNRLLQEINKYLLLIFNSNVYRSENNSLTVLPLIPSKKADKIEKQLLLLENRMDKTWVIMNKKILVNCHVDFIKIPEDTKDLESLAEILDFIERCHTYTDSTSFVRRVDEKLKRNKLREDTILKLLKNAIKNDGFEINYQPIYNIQEKKFTNSEALVRLKDETTLGYISPEEFIPLAEKNGLILEISEKIFKKIFKFLSENNLDKKGIKHMEVNLSGQQSVEEDLPEKIKALIYKNGIKPDLINLEITESMAIKSGTMLQKNIKELKELGCTFSMDDFGTGYSNLSQMAKVDYELIKIDKSLLWPCFDKKNPDRKNAEIILYNMIEMILNLNKKIVVEGVETKEQFDYLEKLKVTYIQGFYFSKPLSGSEYVEFLKKYN